MFENIAADIKIYATEYRRSSFFKQLIYLFFRQDLWAVVIFRFGKWVHEKCKVPVLNYILKIIYFFLRKISEVLLGVSIWPEAEIGPGLNVHFNGVFIKAKIGKNCVISQQVIIGHSGGRKGGGVPVIGDNVYVGAGAKLLGDIVVGNNVKIGANAVVVNDIPDNSVAVGIPAKIVKNLKKQNKVKKVNEI